MKPAANTALSNRQSTILEKCKVATNGVKGQKCVLASKNINRGDVLLRTPIRDLVPTSTRTSINVGWGQHIEAYDSLALMDHSFTPNTWFKIEAGILQVIALRDILDGERVTFNYNSTEYLSPTPFQDYNTGQWMRGWCYLSDMEKDALRAIAAPHQWNGSRQQQCRSEYRVKGLTVVDNVFPADLCAEVAASVMGSRKHFSAVDAYEPLEDNLGAPYPPEIMDEGDLYRFKFLPYDKLAGIAGQVSAWYDALLPLVRDITNEDAILSPYFKSRVLALIYEKGDRGGIHRDTQPIAALAYMTTPKGGGTTATLFDGTTVSVPCKAGSILFMQGRHVRHGSDEVLGGVKVALPMNYYTTMDTWRPETLDREDYWTRP